MMFLAYTAISFLVIRFLVTLINFLSRPVLKAGKAEKESALVSVLVPARNEEPRISALLDDLLRSDYRNLEILVYDDESEDRTAELVGLYARQDQRVRLIEGTALPPGWLGKNHACHKLSLESKGEFLLFLDADVRVSPGLIGSALLLLGRHQLSLLSLFPVQVMRTFGEKITVPLINWVLLSLLPLWLIRLTRRPSLAAANGQFMLFEASSYHSHQWHRRVSNDRVEDIRIIRNMKGAGYQCQTLLSNGQVTCQMYDGFGEAINGFSKNVNAFFGNSWMMMILFAILSTFGPLFVVMALPLWTLLGYLVAAILLKTMVSVLSKQPVFLNIVLMPLQQFSLWIIIITGAYRQLTGTLMWRGRKIAP